MDVLFILYLPSWRGVCEQPEQKGLTAVQELIGKKVIVISSETTYRGILIEIGEHEVHLRSETGWIVVPVDRIVDIKAAE